MVKKVGRPKIERTDDELNARKQRLREMNREYKLEHKDETKEYNRQYYLKNREKNLKSEPCPCGGSFNYVGRRKHERTKIHQRYLLTLNEE